MGSWTNRKGESGAFVIQKYLQDKMKTRKNIVVESITLCDKAKEKYPKEKFHTLCDEIANAQEAIITFAYERYNEQNNKKEILINHSEAYNNAISAIETLNNLSMDLTGNTIFKIQDYSEKEVTNICIKYNRLYVEYMIIQRIYEETENRKKRKIENRQAMLFLSDLEE